MLHPKVSLNTFACNDIVTISRYLWIRSWPQFVDIQQHTGNSLLL